jgi:hypothetical protein
MGVNMLVSTSPTRFEETLLTATISHPGSLKDGAESYTFSPGRPWRRGHKWSVLSPLHQLQFSNFSTGMRNSAQVLIYIDVQKALDAGITFSLSENGVVLTEGDVRGFLSPEYFLRVEDRQSGPLSSARKPSEATDIES